MNFNSHSLLCFTIFISPSLIFSSQLRIHHLMAVHPLISEFVKHLVWDVATPTHCLFPPYLVLSLIHNSLCAASFLSGIQSLPEYWTQIPYSHSHALGLLFVASQRNVCVRACVCVCVCSVQRGILEELEAVWPAVFSCLFHDVRSNVFHS